MNLVFHIDEST